MRVQVVDAGALGKYNDVFRFFLTLKRATLCSRGLWHLLHTRRRSACELTDVSASHQLHLMRLHAHELCHFTSTIEAYFVTFACEDCWSRIRTRVASADSIAALRQAHEEYVDAAWRHCLLHPGGASVQELVRAILKLVIALHHQTETSGWEAVATASRRHFALLKQALVRAMPSLMTVCETQRDDMGQMGHDHGMP
jgi:hypothetical protein